MKHCVYWTAIAHNNIFRLFGVIQCMQNISRVTIKNSLGFPTMSVLHKLGCLAKEDT